MDMFSCDDTILMKRRQFFDGYEHLDIIYVQNNHVM